MTAEMRGSACDSTDEDLGLFDFDHTSIAVRDAHAWGRYLRRELGATPIGGEVLPTFRYVMFHVGTTDYGSRLELIEPEGRAGFLARFLDRHGDGPHHLTFMVPHLVDAIARARQLGYTVVGEELDHERWREAFLMPDGIHGVVIQLAQSNCEYPSPQVLLADRTRETESFPSSEGATDPRWWEFVWSEDPKRRAELGPTILNSTDLASSGRLFADLLGGTAAVHPNGVEFAWPHGTLVVQESPRPGIDHVRVRHAGGANFRIGSARLLSDRPESRAGRGSA